MQKVAFVDVDNTLWDFEAEMRRRMVEVLGEENVPEVMTYWEEPEVLMGSKEAACAIFNEMHATQHHYEPYDSAQQILKDLRRMGYKILIATNRLPETRESLELFLDEWELPYDELWCALDKQQLFDQRDDIAFVFDDAPYIIEEAIKRNIQTIALRFEYNKNIIDHNLTKFNSCFAIHDYLTRKMLW